MTMTLTTLKERIQGYLERGTAADPKVYAELTNLINLAEKNIEKIMNVAGVRIEAVGELEEDNWVVAKPGNWRRTVSINFGTGATNRVRKPLFPRSYEYCRSYWPNEEETGEPEFYADYNDNNWLITPTPDRDYPFEVIYYGVPVPLSDTNQTNWLTEKFPNVILYGALKEVAIFLKNPGDAQLYEGEMMKAISGIAEDDMKKAVDRSVTRQES